MNQQTIQNLITLVTAVTVHNIFEYQTNQQSMFSLAASNLSRASRRSASPLSSRFFHASGADLAKLKVEELAEKVNLEGQNVLMRVDLNAPLSKEVRYLIWK